MLTKTEMEVQRLTEAGFTMRPATMGDVESATVLFNKCSMTMAGIEAFDLEEVRSEWQTPGFNLSASTRVVESADGQLAGYIEVWDINENPVQPWVWGRVRPDYEGRGIGTTLMTWAEERARQAIGRVPDDAQVVMRCGTIHTYEPPRKLFQECGLRHVRSFWDMEIELDKATPPPEWPEGITLKTFAEVDDLVAVYRATDEAFQDHWGYVARSEEEDLRRWRHWLANDKHFEPTLWFLAMDKDEIAAVCLCRPKLPGEPDTGHVETLGVRRPWRRKGLALALLHHTFTVFRQRRQKRVSLGVDAQSLTGATRLYQKAGMHVKRQFDGYEKVLRPGKDLRRNTLGGNVTG